MLLQMEKDMANYIQYKMGFSQNILMVEGAMPSKFHCQLGHKKRQSGTTKSRSAYMKCLKTDIVQEHKVETQAATDTPGTNISKDDNSMLETVEAIGM